ncbi:MAG: DUF4412 domain-containing protein [Candidatus Omnitrophica bacterium]|nr:DUF4412 domain-containing protein [Candidatus Omnitrophota bacterium]
MRLFSWVQRRFVRAAVLGVCFLLTAAPYVLAQDFSARMVARVAGQDMQGRIAVSQDRARMELGGMTTIVRTDLGVIWMLIPQQRMYMEMPLDAQHLAAVGADNPQELEREFLGMETVEGEEVEKYRILYDTGEQEAAIIAWIRPESEIPVKTVAEDGSWEMAYHDIREGPQPDRLFDVPSGYQMLVMPMNMLEGIGGLSGLGGLSGMTPDTGEPAGGSGELSEEVLSRVQELLQHLGHQEDIDY